MSADNKKETITISKDQVFSFLKSSRVQWAVVIILLLIILSTSYSIRVSNIDRLVDTTNSENIPLALDPFYFMRVAQTYIDSGGVMPDSDPLRFNPKRATPWHSEIHPYIVANMYLALAKFDPSFTLEYVYVLSPAIFYLIGLVLFFFICFMLTKDKWLSLLASAFLAFTPAFLYRTMAGFADHESVGMMAFFLVMLVYILSINNIGRKKDPYWKALAFGAFTGLVTTLTFALWAGIVKFVVIIFPMSMFLVWIFNTRKKNEKFMYSFLIFYVSWMALSILLAPLLSQNIKNILATFTGSEGIIAPAILVFIIIDTLFLLKKFSFVKQKLRIWYSLGTTAVVGAIALIATGRNPFSFLSSISARLLKPIGFGRFGSTVAENQSPYLSQWIAQSGDVIFWLFIFGTFIFGYEITKKIKDVKRRWILFLLYITMITGIIFSKYSSSSVLNGESLVSVLFYFVPLIAFWVYFLVVYTKEDFKMTKMQTVIFSWMFLVMISGRGAARVFFTITPGVVFLSSYFVFTSLKNFMISKDRTLKIAFVLLFVFSLVFSLVAVNESYKAISGSAQHTGPSAHIQWQQAMSWVRDNTPEGSVFVHWWDYGYWVESLGQRKTVADGGHFQGSEDGNHKIGRYVLTTPNPETAFSYFKSMEVDYLLIDPTELGKYSAYSRIGSDTNWDRFSIIPTGRKDPRYTTESKNRTVELFNIQGAVDQDIYYSNGSQEIFLPGPSYLSDGTPSFKSYLAGVYVPSNEEVLFAPEGIFVYNNVQHRIPIRYVYFGDRLFDYGTGLDAVVYLVPAINEQGGGQISVDPLGGMVYLSPKVSKTLYAQLYLLDDAFGNYPTVELAYMQDSPVIQQLRSFNPSSITSEFIFYQGFQGPIKMWKTGYPEDTPAYDEFPDPLEGRYASLDVLFNES